MRARGLFVSLPLMLGLAHAPRSGQIGIFALVDKVVFEPNDSTPDRIQVWGAFSYVDGGLQGGYAVTVARKGYMYFAIPHFVEPGATVGKSDKTVVERVRKEWADLKAVAGTGQAVGFGQWGYGGNFSAIEPLQPIPAGGAFVIVRIDTTGQVPVTSVGSSSVAYRSLGRVRPVDVPVENPVSYPMTVGVVKLPEWSHADVIKKLRDALGK